MGVARRAVMTARVAAAVGGLSLGIVAPAASVAPPPGSVGHAEATPAGHPDSEANRGFRCDDNPGVGDGNPAHLGCQPAADAVTPPGPDPAIGQDPAGSGSPAPERATEVSAVVLEPAGTGQVVSPRLPGYDTARMGDPVSGQPAGPVRATANAPASSTDRQQLPSTGGELALLGAIAVALLALGADLVAVAAVRFS